MICQKSLWRTTYLYAIETCINENNEIGRAWVIIIKRSLCHFSSKLSLILSMYVWVVPVEFILLNSEPFFFTNVSSCVLLICFSKIVDHGSIYSKRMIFRSKGQIKCVGYYTNRIINHNYFLVYLHLFKFCRKSLNKCRILCLDSIGQ